MEAVHQHKADLLSSCPDLFHCCPVRFPACPRPPHTVVPGLVPGTHVLRHRGVSPERTSWRATWMAGTSPAMTMWGGGGHDVGGYRRGLRLGLLCEPRFDSIFRNPVESRPCTMSTQLKPDSNGLVPGIHVPPSARPLRAHTAMPQDVDARNKSRHDEKRGGTLRASSKPGRSRRCSWCTPSPGSTSRPSTRSTGGCRQVGSASPYFRRHLERATHGAIRSGPPNRISAAPWRARTSSRRDRPGRRWRCWAATTGRPPPATRCRRHGTCSTAWRPSLPASWAATGCRAFMR